MESTPEKQHRENVKQRQRVLARRLGRKHLDAEKFADMSTSGRKEPSQVGPTSDVYKTPATKRRVGVLRRPGQSVGKK